MEVLHQIRSDTLGQTYTITGRPTRPMPPSLTNTRQFAAHFVEIEVDVETGQTKIIDYLAAQDSGTVVNPQVLKNQVIGGAICGLGFALYEELLFDPKTGPGTPTFSITSSCGLPTSPGTARSSFTNPMMASDPMAQGGQGNPRLQRPCPQLRRPCTTQPASG